MFQFLRKAAVTTATATLVWHLLQRIRHYIRFVGQINALPGSEEWHPIYGNVKSMFETIGTIPTHPRLPNTIEWFCQRMHHYEHDGIYRCWLFHPYYLFFMARTAVFMLHPQLIRQVLTENQDKLVKERRYYKLAECLIGSSFLALPDGPQWKHQRKMTAPAFNSNFLEQVHSSVLQLLEKHFFPYYDNEEDKADEKSHVSDNSTRNKAPPLEAMEWSARLTLDVLGLVAFSHSFGGSELYAQSQSAAKQQQQLLNHVCDGNGKENHNQNRITTTTTDQPPKSLYDCFVIILSTIARRNVSIIPFGKYLPTQENRLFRQASRRLDHTVGRIVKERLRMEEEQEENNTDLSTTNVRIQSNEDKDKTINGGNDDKDNVKKDILSYMLRRDPETGERMAYHSIVADVRMLLFAGHDTTAALVAWAFWELAQNPSSQAKLYNEIMEEVTNHGGNTTSNFTYKWIAALPYLDSVVRETLRLHSAAGVARVVTRDIQVRHPIDKGRVYSIPRGTRLMMVPIYTQRIYTPKMFHHHGHEQPKVGNASTTGTSSDNDQLPSGLPNKLNNEDVNDNHAFNPERFLVQNNSINGTTTTKVGQEWYLPFSVGSRNWYEETSVC